MKKTLLILLNCFFLTTTCAQVISFDNEENFAFQVKQIDEFIERFNNEDSTLIKKYMEDNYDVDQFNRLDLLKTLFNYTDVVWNVDEVTQFLSDVTKTDNPVLLDFLDDNWYAELDCSGSYKGINKKFKLILKIQVNEEKKASKWVITSVQADFFQLPEASSSQKTLNPASHGTDFMGLKIAFKDGSNIGNYIAEEANTSQLLLFFHELQEKNIIFDQVDDITYHFLQIENWIFQVRDFKRNTTNSGWLICALIHVNEDDKKYYKKEKLFLL
jgi:hypothetical protein